MGGGIIAVEPPVPSYSGSGVEGIASVVQQSCERPVVAGGGGGRQLVDGTLSCSVTSFCCQIAAAP